jgi:hypothetical protein
MEPQKPYNKDFTGLWIPKEIWDMEDLNLTEKNVLALIYSLSATGKGCTASNYYFANLFGLTKKHASVIINSLSRKKRIGILKKTDTLSRIIRIPHPEKNGKGIPINTDHIINNNNKVDNKEDIKQIPDFETFKNYALEHQPNTDLHNLECKYKSWVEAGWKTGKGEKIKIWKSTLLNTLPYLKKENQKTNNGLRPGQILTATEKEKENAAKLF